MIFLFAESKRKGNKNKILNGESMNRFVESFYEFEMSKLVTKINEYAIKNNLKIISLSTNNNLHGAIVLFEGEKPKYKW